MNSGVLLMFLEMFGARRICATCLARLADDDNPTLISGWLDSHVADGSMVRAQASCLNCEETTPVYRLDAD
jgi:hypothetical protein